MKKVKITIQSTTKNDIKSLNVKTAMANIEMGQKRCLNSQNYVSTMYEHG